MKRRRHLLVLGALVGLAVVGLFAYRLVSGDVSKVFPRSGSVTTGRAVGAAAPEFAVTTLDGEPVSNSRHRGQVVVLTSSAAWCSTCALEAEQLRTAFEALEGQPVTFVTIDIDPRDDPSAIAAFRTRMRTPWAYADARGGRGAIEAFRLDRFEITYVLDGEGVIRYKDQNITNAGILTTEIERLLTQ